MQDRYNNLTGSDYVDIGKNLFGTGVTVYTKEKERQIAQAQANALRDKGLSEIEVAKIMQQTEKLKLEAIQSSANAKSKTLYIALGVGAVVVLGVVIYAVTRK